MMQASGIQKPRSRTRQEKGHEPWNPKEAERRGKPDDVRYFCMDYDANSVERVNCNIDGNVHDCWYYYPLWDHKRDRWVGIRRKVGEFSDTVGIGLTTSSFRPHGKDKPARVVMEATRDHTICFVNGKESLVCFSPNALVEEEKTKHPCPA